jgi:uncharacterized protein (TIGR02646 family)
MIKITKGIEPASIERYRRRKGANYKSFSRDAPAEFQEVKNCLAAEQGYVCCYCMGKISPNPGKMTIEHLKCRDNYPNLQLAYNNLLGACVGSQGHSQPKRLMHCNPYKANRDLHLNPLDPDRDVEELVQYEIGDGSIYSTEDDIQSDLEDILNLNVEHLKSARANVLSEFLWAFANEEGIDSETWRERLKMWIPEEGRIPAYFGIIRFFVNQKLKALETV